MTVAVGDVILHDDETMLGFASRLAASFGMPLIRFLKYKGIDYTKFRHNNEVEVGKLARQWALDPDLLRSRMWNYSTRWLYYGVPENLYDTLDWTRPRYCPVCVTEDFARGRGTVEARPYQRLGWLSPLVTVCCRHAVRLKNTPAELAKTIPGDFALAISSRREEIEAEAENAEVVAVGTADHYFHDRMTNPSHRDAFLDQVTTYSAFEVCKALGRLHAPKKTKDIREQVQRGYDIIHEGEKALISYLDSILAENLHQGRRTKKSVYGDLYALIGYARNPDRFGPVVSIIREHGLANLPLAEGEDFLGPVDRRRFHSVRSAAIQHGIKPRLVKRTFAEHGLIAKQALKRVDGDLLVPADDADALLWRLNVPVTTLAEFKSRTGINYPTVVQLLKAGILTRAGFKDGIEFEVSAVESLADRLFTGLKYVPTGGHMVDVKMAFHKTLVPLHDLIGLVLDGRLTAYKSTKARTQSIRCLLFDERELAKFSRHQAPQGGGGFYTAHDVEKLLSTSGDTVKHLLNSGVLKFKRGAHNARLVSQHDVEVFRARFISLAEAFPLVSGSFTSTMAWLAENGVEAQIKSDIANVATFYLRAEVMALIASGSRPKRQQFPRRRTPIK